MNKLDEATLERLKQTLWESIVTGKIPMVKKILENFTFLINEPITALGTRPLHQAILSGRVDVAKLLVDIFKADTNAKDLNGKTPLHIAASCGNKPLVTYLVANKADVNSQTIGDETPVMKACMFGEEGVMNDLLFNHKANIALKNKSGQNILDLVKLYFSPGKYNQIFQALQNYHPNINIGFDHEINMSHGTTNNDCYQMEIDNSKDTSNNMLFLSSNDHTNNSAMLIEEPDK